MVLSDPMPTGRPRGLRLLLILPLLVSALGPVTRVAAAEDPVLLAAGDIGDCTSSGDEATAALLDGVRGTVAALGDIAYPNGTAANFRDCYAPSWGRHKARTRPAVGNHEYKTAGAIPYFDYFGAAAGPRGKGWYSRRMRADIAAGHLAQERPRGERRGACAGVLPPPALQLR
jgi:hypothetical protein